MHPLLRSWAVPLLLVPGLSSQSAAQPGDHALRVHIGKGQWVSREEAGAKGFFFYKDRWLPKKLSAKLKYWERLDPKVKSWSDAYQARSKHYRIKTNAPHYVTELELKPFLDELYRTYVKVFKDDFGLSGRAADKNHIHVYWGYSTWQANAGSDRGSPGYYEPGGALKVMYDPTDEHDFYNTVFHEGAHQFFMATLPGASLPVWLDEALATYFEGCTYSRAMCSITKNHIPADRLVDAKEQLLRAKQAGEKLTPSAMFMHIGNIDSFDASHYALAWSFLHYLIHREDGKHKKDFYKFLKEMNGSGTKPVQRVFKEATRTDLEEIEKGWASYVLALETPPLPGWQVLTPRHATPDEDVQNGDLLVRVNGHTIDTEADWEKHWGQRDKSKPQKLLLLRRYDIKSATSYQQKFVTLIVKPGSKLELEAGAAIPHPRNLVD